MSERAPSVLLVDDRSENLTALSAVLEPLVDDGTLHLALAESAEEALRQVLLLGDALAVVLLDVMMPGTDGFATARLIRQRARSQNVPVIFITALDVDRRRVNLGYQSGAVDYLTKPLDPDVIRGKVRAFVDLHRLRGQSVLTERRRYADAAAEAERVAQGRLDAARGDEGRVVETIQRMGTVLAAEADLGRLVQAVTEEATALTNAQFGAFFYNREDEAGQRYTLYALAGIDPSRFASFPQPRATPVFGPTFRGEGVVRSDDITADSRYGQVAPHFGMPKGHPPVRSYLAVPVQSRLGVTLGGLFFGHADIGVFGDREESLALGIAGWAAVAMDNARLYEEERNARAEADRRRTEAEAANRAKAEFLATMSHELRTPLNAIGGYVNLLEMGLRGPITNEQRVDLDRIHASQQHLLGLVNEVLDLAKADAGQLRVAHAPALAGDTVEAALALVRPQAAAKALTLSQACEGAADRRYIGDEPRVRQVLVNLLGNAVKFTGAGGQVSVECMVTEAIPAGAALHAAAPYVALRVADTGPGIPADQFERIFEPFTQVESSANPYTRTTGGTGLGLAISRRLARLMGGDLTLESREGEGSVFTLWLPTPELRAEPRRPDDPSGDALTTLVSDAVPDASTPPEDLAILLHVGGALLAGLPAVLGSWVARLRADPAIPNTTALTAADLEDHASTYVADIALTVRAIGQRDDASATLLRDGVAIRNVISERHGAQRARLGWGDSAIRREFALLREVLDAAVARAVPTDDIRVAARAKTVVADLLAHAERVTLDGHRLASGASARGS